MEDVNVRLEAVREGIEVQLGEWFEWGDRVACDELDCALQCVEEHLLIVLVLLLVKLPPQHLPHQLALNLLLIFLLPHRLHHKHSTPHRHLYQLLNLVTTNNFK